MRSRLSIRVATAAVALVVAMLAAGCLRTEVSIDVNDDGSGTVAILMALEETMIEAMSEFSDEDVDPEDPFGDITADDLPPGATAEEYQQDGFTGVRVTVPFAASDDVARSINDVFASMDDGTGGLTGSDGLFQQFSLQREGDRWEFHAEVDASSDKVSAGMDPEADLAMARAMFGELIFGVRLNLPGEVVDHDADEVLDDGALRWNIDLLTPETRTLNATSDVNNGSVLTLGAIDLGGNTALLLVLVVIAVLIVGAAGLAIMRTRGSDEA